MNFEDNRLFFLEEARELLNSLEKNLIELESSPDDSALINEVFRGLHTIKGSGAMFGFEKVSQFTHLLENLFDEVRKGTLKVDSDIVGIGLRSTDCISSLLEGKEGGEVQARLVAEITALGAASPRTAASAAREDAEDHCDFPTRPQASPSGPPMVYRVELKPIPGLLHRGVKLECLFRELQGMGDFHSVCDVSAVPELGALDPSAVYFRWTITLSTQADMQAVRSVFMFIEDYSELSVKIVTERGEGEGARAPLLGEVLVDRGLIDEEEVATLRHEQVPLGELAVKAGRVSKGELDAALAEQQAVKSASIEREVRQESSTIRVRKERLDFLVDSVGELVILQARLGQEAKSLGSVVLEGIAENLSRLTTVLRDSTMGLRMVPLAESFASFQRLVRDLSKQLGKDLRLEIEGAGTELDKNVIESLKDPLVHIIRNSADHGIEDAATRARAGKPAVGTISVAARQVGSSVEIVVRDDGAGLDLDRIKAKAVERRLLEPDETDEDKIIAVIMEPGFSTTERATSLSGRGVGMDVVRTNIEKLRGSIAIATERGGGTTMTLSIPLTLVIVDGLLVTVGGVDYVVALSLVEECVDMALGGAEGSSGTIHLRGRTIPVLDVHRILLGDSVPRAGEEGEARLVIASVDGAEVALRVDAIVGKQQVVIKPFTAALKGLTAISGATILGDGSVALILNLADLVKTSRGEVGIIQARSAK